MAALNGLMPPDMNETIPAGQEETFIQLQLAIKHRVEVDMDEHPVEMKIAFNELLEKRAKKN